MASWFTGRRKFSWDRLRGPQAYISTLIATAMGAGLFPIAPGTMGTLMSVPLVGVTYQWAWGPRCVFWILITLIGTWSAAVFDSLMETEDNQNIVIDEVVGFGITSWTVGADIKTWVAAFLLFRFFDVVKPPPIRQVDRWSRNRAEATLGRSTVWGSFLGGFGVMADDILAGFQGLAVILIFQWVGLLG